MPTAPMTVRTGPPVRRTQQTARPAPSIGRRNPRRNPRTRARSRPNPPTVWSPDPQATRSTRRAEARSARIEATGSTGGPPPIRTDMPNSRPTRPRTGRRRPLPTNRSRRQGSRVREPESRRPRQGNRRTAPANRRARRANRQHRRSPKSRLPGTAPALRLPRRRKALPPSSIPRLRKGARRHEAIVPCPMIASPQSSTAAWPGEAASKDSPSSSSSSVCLPDPPATTVAATGSAR